MFFQKIRQCGERVAVELAQFQISRRLVIGKPVVTFPIISAAAVGILPAESFVDVVGGEGGGGPVVPVGTGFRIYKETVKQTETLRQRVMIGRNDLARTIGTLRGDAISKNGKSRFAVGSVSVAGSFHVAENMIVGAIFLDDVTEVLNRAWP